MDWQRKTHTPFLSYMFSLSHFFLFCFPYSVFCLFSVSLLLLSTLPELFKTKFPKCSHFRNELFSPLLLFFMFFPWCVVTCWPSNYSLTFWYTIQYINTRSLSSLKISHVVYTYWFQDYLCPFSTPVMSRFYIQSARNFFFS